MSNDGMATCYSAPVRREDFCDLLGSGTIPTFALSRTGSGRVRLFIVLFFTCPNGRSHYANAVFVRLGHFLLIIALLGATGGHWAVLQTIAWAGMLASNLKTESVNTALSKTFDGEHPCQMCKAIKQGRSEAKEPVKIVPVEKLPPALIWEATAFNFGRKRERIANANEFSAPGGQAPPKPRPRAGFLPSLI